MLIGTYLLKYSIAQRVPGTRGVVSDSILYFVGLFKSFLHTEYQDKIPGVFADPSARTDENPWDYH
jgi:hypothetical protein